MLALQYPVCQRLQYLGVCQATVRQRLLRLRGQTCVLLRDRVVIGFQFRVRRAEATTATGSHTCAAYRQPPASSIE